MTESDRALLEAKIALENELIRPLFRALAVLAWSWARASGALNVFERTGHQQAIERVLSGHYARVAMVATGRSPTADATIDQAALSLRHGSHMRTRAQRQAQRMVQALERDLVTILQAQPFDDVSVKADEPQKPSFTASYLAKFKTTAQQAIAKVKAKIKAIANVETQEIAESSRFEWVEQEKATGRVVMIWRNMGDERVRGNPSGIYARSHFDHWSAEGQERPVDIPFDISGEQMKFPGDASLGASIGNRINCRCTAEFWAIGPNGEREMIGLETARIPAKRTWHRGDRMGIETPVRPTTIVTLNGRTRARVVLGDGRTFATLRQTSPTVIEVVAGGRVVARATHSGGTTTSLTVAPGFEAHGIDRLIRDSVTHSARRR